MSSTMVLAKANQTEFVNQFAGSDAKRFVTYTKTNRDLVENVRRGYFVVAEDLGLF